MLTIALDELVAATGGTVVARVGERFGGAGIDGRTVRPGEVFFAIVGDRFDGHDFCGQAVAAGADAVVVARGRAPSSLPRPVTVVEVNDPRLALGQLARAWRRRQRARVIGITGSTGKTTTKELVAAMLRGVAGEGGILATEGSLNNETGVPLTLLRLRDEHVFAVVEMGMRGLGQIDYLTAFAEPEVGVVVNAGVAHVGVVGSVEAIARGKSEIWGRLPPGGAAVYPAGDGRLSAHAQERAPTARHVTFGAEEAATVRIVETIPRGVDGSEARFRIRAAGGDRELACRVPLVGRHNVDNAACALAVAVALGVDLDAAARGLAAARPAKQRGEIIEVQGRKVLLDCYNANPTSMRAALATLAELSVDRGAVAVLGDMLELGDAEAEEHAKVGEAAATLGLRRLVTLGERARHLARAARARGLRDVVEAADPAEAADAVLDATAPGDWILVKASRGMQLERVVAEMAKGDRAD